MPVAAASVYNDMFACIAVSKGQTDTASGTTFHASIKPNTHLKVDYYFVLSNAADITQFKTGLMVLVEFNDEYFTPVYKAANGLLE